MPHFILFILCLSAPAMVLAASDTTRITTDSAGNQGDTVAIVPVKKTVAMKPAFRSKTGYRLQVLKTQKRDHALLMKARLMESLPDTRVYMTYRAPFYRVRVGNFLSREAALQFSRRHLDSMRSVFVVRDKVIYTWFPPGWSGGE
jgi:hypothetical protein